MIHINIDLDNVVLEWQTHWADLYMDHKLASWGGLPEAQLSQWDACLRYTHFETMTEFYAWFDSVDGWATQPYLPGAEAVLSWLKKQRNVSFSFLTARPTGDGREAALALANKWGVMVKFADAADKWQADGDLWLDDAPEVLASLREHGRESIRFAQPWNEHCKADHVVRNWGAVKKLIQKVVS